MEDNKKPSRPVLPVPPQDVIAELIHQVGRLLQEGGESFRLDHTELLDAYSAIQPRNEMAEAFLESFNNARAFSPAVAGRTQGDEDARELAKFRLMFYNAMNIAAMQGFPNASDCEVWLDNICNRAALRESAIRCKHGVWAADHCYACERESAREAPSQLDSMLVQIALHFMTGEGESFGERLEILRKMGKDYFSASGQKLTDLKSDGICISGEAPDVSKEK